jgi:hypothetical protein
MDTKVRNSTVKMWAIKMATRSDNIWEAKHTKDCLLVLVIAEQNIYIPKSNCVCRPICACLYASKKANVQSSAKLRILISEIAGCSFPLSLNDTNIYIPVYLENMIKVKVKLSL